MNFKKQISEDRDNIITAAQELVRIKSIKEKGVEGMPFGEKMYEALTYVLNLAEKMGFSVKMLDGYCGYVEYGEGDLYIGIISHVDICGEGEMWAVPPFEGRIVDNKIYGRGSMDNKGPLIAALYALKAVKDTGKKLNKKVRFIIGTDEERYYEDMRHYLKVEKPPIAGFTLDGHFPVVYAEKGLAMMEYRGGFCQTGKERIAYLKGGTAENTVPGHCEAFLQTERQMEIVNELTLFSRESRHNMSARIEDDGVIIESCGMETHSMALEMGINAICPMISFLNRIHFGEGKTRKLISFLNNYLGYDIYGEKLGVNCEDSFSGKFTVNFGIIHYDGETATVRLDIRYPVMCKFEESADRLKEVFQENGFEETERSFWDPVYFPKEHFLIEALLRAYRQVTKDRSGPIVSASGSYSKVIPNIAAFGAIFPGGNPAWHRVNEYIEIDSLLKMAEIYATAIYELGSL